MRGENVLPRPGGQPTYSDLAIEAALTIRMILRLPLRQTGGFLRSLAGLLGLGLPIPDHNTLSRRLQKLGNLRFRKLAGDEPVHLLIDSTGLRAHVGHLRKPPKRRVWRKLHLAVNAETGEVLASDLTNRRTADCARVPELLDQIDDRVASYSRRSLVENAVFRYKTIFGQRMRSRFFGSQRVEVCLACKILGHDDQSGDAR